MFHGGFYMQDVPRSLRIWFLIHFIVDMVFALPLLINPYWVFHLFGFSSVEPLTARLVGAALIGIGGASFFIYKKGIEAFNALLTLKILWSIAAIIAIAISIIEGGPQSEWLFLAIFVLFSAIWIYYKRILLSG
jgi:hypothetical protein